MSSRSSTSKKRLKIFLYILGIFLFQEIVIRYCYPLPELSNFDRIDYMVLHADEKGNKHSRNQNWYWQSTPDTSTQFVHTMNMYGFRDKEWTVEKTAGVKRAFFVGDSFVEGIMAEQDQTIPSAFEKAAGEGTYEAFNCGMLGVGLDSYLQFITDAVPIYKPDVVFLCVYANDLGQRTPMLPEHQLNPTYFQTFRPRFLELTKQSKTNGKVRPIWNDESVPYFSACPHPSNPWSGKEAELKEIVDPEIAQFITDGKLNPYRVEEFAEEIEYLNKVPALGETISTFKRICEENGSQPVLVYIPTRNQVTRHYYRFERRLSHFPDSLDMTSEAYQLHQRILAQQCAENKIQFIDLSATIREREADGDRLFWNYDAHMKGKGYQLVGKTIWEQFHN